MATIYIIEGPAGVGKSTWLKAVGDHPGRVVIQSSLEAITNSRLPDQYAAAVGSAINDYSKLIRAIAATTFDEAEEIYIDRCILSHLVYSSVRTQRTPMIHEARIMGRRWLEHGSMMFHRAISELQGRGVAVEPSHLFRYRILLPPSWDVLKERRANSPKTYPSGHMDYEIYKMVAEYLWSNHYRDKFGVVTVY